MKSLDRISTKVLAGLAGLSVAGMALALVLGPVHAQSVGPGGVPGAGSGGAVSSVFGRTGAVVAASGDYTAAQVTNAADVTAANTFSGTQTIASGYGITFDGYGTASVWNDPQYVDALIFTEDSIGSNGQVILNLAPGNSNAPGVILQSYSGCIEWDAGIVNPPSATFCEHGTLANTYTLGSSPEATDGWLQLSAIGNGASGNTDLRGHVTLASGAGTYAFTKTYTVAPTCTASDTTAKELVQPTTTTTTLTLAGTGSDVIAYVCAD